MGSSGSNVRPNIFSFFIFNRNFIGRVCFSDERGREIMISLAENIRLTEYNYSLVDRIVHNFATAQYFVTT